MLKLTKKANRYERTDGPTDPKYRKASLIKIVLLKTIRDIVVGGHEKKSPNSAFLLTCRY